jgi:hypothetical protein
LHHLWIINFLSPFTRCCALWSLLEFHHLWITKNDWHHWRVIEINPYNCFFRVSFTQNWSPQPFIYPSTWNWSPLSIIINALQLMGKLKVIYIITNPPKEIDSQFLFFFIKIGRAFFVKGINLGQRWWQTLYEEKFHVADGKAEACTQGALFFFLLSFGGQRKDYFSFFLGSQCVSTMFLLSSQWVPLGSQYVPQVPNVFPTCSP